MRATLALVLCAITLVAATALTGNWDAVDPEAIQDSAASPTSLRHSVGQTFLSHYARLSAIQVRWSLPNGYTAPPAARVTLHLRAAPNAADDLAAASMPLDQTRNNEFHKFTFDPIPDSENKSFYFFLETSADAPGLWSSGDDAYADGTLYVNHLPIPGDLSFRAYYQPDLAMLARALVQTLSQFWIPILCFALTLLSFLGFALHRLFAPFVFLFALALATALLQLRDFPAPLWVDSVTHAQYIQFILTHTRLPLSNFYHLGFHVLTALLARLFNLAVPQAILLAGQFAWVLAGAAVFCVSRKLSGSDFAGLSSALGVWFLSPTPAYFITWGRYPLVLGSALLPLALICAIKLIEQKNARAIFLASITFAALAFTQIRLVAFYAAFLGIGWVVARRLSRKGAASSPPKLAPNSQFHFPLSILPALFLCISFSLPFAIWFLYLFNHGVTPQSIVAQNQTAPSIDLETAFAVLQTHHGIEFLALAALSAILGLVRRSRVTFHMLGWLAALVALALVPPVMGELVPPSLVVLMAFLPASIWIGEAAQFAYQRWRAPNRVVHAAVWGALLGCVSLLGARDMVNIANPATILFTRADERAMQWIEESVPTDSKFLVNSFNWFGAVFVPSDGGAWIPYFADRPIEYLDAVLPDNAESVSPEWVAARGIRYIYLGARTGVLHAADFLAHPEWFALTYARAGVKIFRVR